MNQHIELLAMNIWMKVFGVKSISPEWISWAAANPQEATALRDQAATMIGVAKSHASQGANAKANVTHHHSLGWLF
jgi:hypothetical protein